MTRGYNIFEIANVHGGKFDYFKDLIKSIENYKAPNFGVKVQVLHPDLIAVKSFPFYDVYKELYFSESEWKEIIDLIHESKDVWIDIFDLYGVEILEKNLDKVYGIKFQASILDNLEVFEALSEIDMSSIRMMINVSGYEMDQIKSKIDFISSKIQTKEIILQIGYQSYPTDIEKAGLNKFKSFQKEFPHKIIYADHTDGKDTDAFLAPVLAMYAGAFGVEKHIMLGDRETKYDFQASITVDQLEDYFNNFNKYVNLLEGEFISEPEKNYLEGTIQKPVAKKSLSKGSFLSEENFYFRRTGSDGLTLDEIRYYIDNGYILRHDIEENQTLNPEDFKKPVIATLIACRLKSSRLPRKATLKIGNLSSTEMCVKNLLRIKEAHHTILATSTHEQDAELENHTYDESVIFHRGDEDDVIKRFLEICDAKGVDIIFRSTADCPYLSSEIATALIESHIKNQADYSAAKEAAVGTAMEVMNVDALKRIKAHFKSAYLSEYMTWYFTNNPEHFKLNFVDLPEKYVRDYRLTLDYQEDLDLFNEIENHFIKENKAYTLEELFSFLDQNPEIANMNKHITLVYKTDQKLIDLLDKETKM